MQESSPKQSRKEDKKEEIDKNPQNWIFSSEFIQKFEVVNKLITKKKGRQDKINALRKMIKLQESLISNIMKNSDENTNEATGKAN